MRGIEKMKVLVVSDSHGDREVLVDLKEHYKGKVAKMFHCGDSELEATDELWESFVVVGGNMDDDSRYPLTQVVTIGENRFFMTHGHYHNIKFTMRPLIEAAKQAEAQFAFFGHSHQLGVEKRENMLLLNPGSISQPRGRHNIKTYAIVDIQQSAVVVTYYDRNHQVLEDLKAIFSQKK